MGTKALSDYMIEGALHTGSIGDTIGDLKFNERYIAISATHPWKNLADTDAELDEANFPDYVPVMRGINIHKYTGSSYWKIESYNIISNVVTVLFNNSDYYINMINGLAEMLLDYTAGVSPTSTDYANWNMCLTLVIDVGVIPAGDYTITNINPSTKQIQFSYVHSDTSGSTGWIAAQFYPYRVPGDSTKCRHRQQLGKTIMTPDFDTFFNGVSWRDHMQGHYHSVTHNLYKPTTNPPLAIAGGTSYEWNQLGTISVLSPSSDGINGDPRTDSQTYPSGLGAFAYRYVGRYVAP